MRFALLLMGFFLFFGLFSFSANAELYQYYDKTGTLCYTDDLSKVPKEQRSRMDTLPEVESKSENEYTTKQRAPEKKQRKNSRTNAGEGGADRLVKEARKLERIKKQLDREYRRLKNRRDELKRLSSKDMDEKETERFNKKARILNKQTIEYKEKRRAYKKRVESYNRKLEQAN